MDAVYFVAVLLVTAAVAYYIGFKDGGRTFLKNLRLTDEAMNQKHYITLNVDPDVDFEAVRDAVVARNNGVSVAKVRADKIGHEYDAD